MYFEAISVGGTKSSEIVSDGLAIDDTDVLAVGDIDPISRSRVIENAVGDARRIAPPEVKIMRVLFTLSVAVSAEVAVGNAYIPGALNVNAPSGFENMNT